MRSAFLTVIAALISFGCSGTNPPAEPQPDGGPPVPDAGDMIPDAGNDDASMSGDADAAPPPDPLSEQPIGYATLEGGTTGGEGGQTVTVTNYDELEAAAEGSSDPLIIKVSGTITGEAQIYVKSNKTILGLPGSKLMGVGLRLSEVSNVILRNLTIEGVVADLGSGDQDAISLKYGTHHVWIDHCDLRAQPVGESFVVNGSEEYYDGLIDITRGCDYVTVSWTKFADSYKAVLIGGGSGETENIGKQHVTLYKNYFLDCLERGPYVGLSTAHVFNDYTRVTQLTGHIGNGISIRDNGQVRTDNNYFDHTLVEGSGMSPSFPIITGYSSSVGGPGVVTNADSNILVNTVEPYITTPPGDFEPPYAYAPIPAADVPAVVSAGAGATLSIQ